MRLASYTKKISTLIPYFYHRHKSKLCNILNKSFSATLLGKQEKKKSFSEMDLK